LGSDGQTSGPENQGHKKKNDEKRAAAKPGAPPGGKFSRQTELVKTGIPIGVLIRISITAQYAAITISFHCLLLGDMLAQEEPNLSRFTITVSRSFTDLLTRTGN
jgi:hypothetical protein